MSSVNPGQMSAVETRQVPVAEPGQMPFVTRRDICLVFTPNVEVSEVSTEWSSLRCLTRGNITVFTSERLVGGLALNR